MHELWQLRGDAHNFKKETRKKGEIWIAATKKVPCVFIYVEIVERIEFQTNNRDEDIKHNINIYSVLYFLSIHF